MYNKTVFFAAALLASGLAAGPVLAAAPADQDACNKQAFELAELAAAKKLPDAQAAKVDELVSKLEGQCAEGKLAEAGATAQEIEAALAK